MTQWPKDERQMNLDTEHLFVYTFRTYERLWDYCICVQTALPNGRLSWAVPG
jgi:hypothetical protein